MKQSLFAEYIKEREDAYSIEHDFGFVHYKITESECFVKDLFIVKDMRSTGLVHDLFRELKESALAHDCTHITGVVWVADLNAKNTLKMAFSLGFELSVAHNGGIKIIYEIGGI